MSSVGGAGSDPCWSSGCDSVSSVGGAGSDPQWSCGCDSVFPVLRALGLIVGWGTKMPCGQKERKENFLN